MFEKVLSPNVVSLLLKIGPVVKDLDFYLAGGTGLALQIGHRTSEDFDFFKKDPFDPEILLSILRNHVVSVEEIVLEKVTLLTRLDGIRCSFLLYDIPLLFDYINFYGIKLADWRDIIAEKIKTISQRGSKKDFYDVFYVINSKRLSIEELVNIFKKRFESTGINFYHVLRSLTYFDEAEEEPDPITIGDNQFNWNEVTSFFRNNIREFEKYL
jgi:predicted nucleic-acid-binding protein